MQQGIGIKNNPELNDSCNYELLRKKGLEYIEKLAGKIWTDFNEHDPGITLLELLSYSITHLGYLNSLDIKDLLAEPESEKPNQDPDRQAFFSPREIMTVNPLTSADYRKLLIDVDGIKNSWLKCKECPCNDIFLYADCSEGKLQYVANDHPIVIKGMYDVLVEFEDIDGNCNLNSGKVKHNLTFRTDEDFSTADVEMRLPSWQKLEDQPDLFKKFRNQGSIIQSISTHFISGNRNDDQNIPPDEVAKILRRPVYATFKVDFRPDKNIQESDSVLFSDIPVRVWFRRDDDRKHLTLDDLSRLIEDSSSSGIIVKYLEMIHKSDEIIQKTGEILHSHRNLCEDFCTIKAVETEEIGVCTDIEVEPSFDIEAVVAEAYYVISQYISPEIKFYSLKELLDEGIPVDEIFEGPKLENGFINNKQMEETNLKEFIYSSDIIHKLMEIEGIKNVRNFVLTKYDPDGRLIKNDEWIMDVEFNHQPGFYAEASKVLVFKNGLPLLPDNFELNDTLQMIKGKNSHPQYPAEELDIKEAFGNQYDLTSYYPLQYSLPLTYGTGYEGLSRSASVLRKAQALQLKAYLMFFEQLLVNFLEQLAHIKDLFAIDSTIDRTYFSRVLNLKEIKDLDKIVNGLTDMALKGLVESDSEFLNRRNRFLDHLLSRFAENFNDYALMLYSYLSNKPVADQKLIFDKIKLLKDYRSISRDRAKAINYKDPDHVCDYRNVSGIQARIKRLLGMDDISRYFEFYEEKDNDGIGFEKRWRLKDDSGKIMLSSTTKYFDKDSVQSEKKAVDEVAVVRQNICIDERYLVKKNKKWSVELTDKTGNIIAMRKQAFKTKAEAEGAKQKIIEFGKKLILTDKIFVVEHLLLRPRNKPSALFQEGDPLLTICTPGTCYECGDFDPYSFRLTFILSGETGIAERGMAFMQFAERTIRMEIPAHLGVKICWVSDAQLEDFEKVYCSWLLELAKKDPDAGLLNSKLKKLLDEFEQLKSVYPPARLFDCREGDESSRVTLNRTII